MYFSSTSALVPVIKYQDIKTAKKKKKRAFKMAPQKKVLTLKICAFKKYIKCTLTVKLLVKLVNYNNQDGHKMLFEKIF